MHPLMKRSCRALVLLAALSATSIFGQESRMHRGGALGAGQSIENRIARLTTLLTLTAAQQTQATSIFTAAQTTITTLRTSLSTARTTLQTAVRANDVTTINAQSTQIGTLTGQQVAAEARAEAAFYALLTPAQQAIYNELRSGGFGRGLRGPGGAE